MPYQQVPRPEALTVMEAKLLQEKINTLYPDIEATLTVDVGINKSNRTFQEYGIVGLWFDGDLVVSISRKDQFHRLQKMAAIILEDFSE